MLFIMALAGALTIAALACPLWMGSMSQQGQADMPMPCSKQDDSPQQCPMSICQASSPYLAAGLAHNVPVFQELSAEVVDVPAALSSSWAAVPDERDDLPPPGAAGGLYLRTHSLLI
jgi:hypothetical protein